MSTATHGSLLGTMRRMPKLPMPVKQDPMMTGTWTKSMLSLLKIQLNYLPLVNCTITCDLQNYTAVLIDPVIKDKHFSSNLKYFNNHSN